MPANAFDGAMPLTESEQISPQINPPLPEEHLANELLRQHSTSHSGLISQPWHRSCSDEVVISGMSGRLPESENVDEFRDHLMNNEDMITDDDRRWRPGVHGLPTRSGKLKDLSKFDATFFGIHAKQANRMDPQLRILLETTYEAIIDSGVNPETLRGTNTGVFVGASSSEASDSWSADAASTTGFTMIGCQRGMYSNRLSYFFDFKGPSFTLDTACSSSLLAMDCALTAIRSGQCDAAVVAGASICIKPATAVQFNNLTMLSPDGACKSFDESGNGYVRSEAIVAIFLQKHKDSNRVYAQLVHSKTNSDGAKEDGKSITFPSGQVQKSLMLSVYEECGVRPVDITYVEAHGTGTKAGDPEEVNSITDVFCKGRQTPLLIGSTKSNMGHPEPASGLAALVKVLVASEHKIIPANLHYHTPNPNIPGLLDGRLQVVSQNTAWTGGLTAINSFGFGGSNVHAVLNTTAAPEKVEKSDHQPLRLLTYCGRSEAGLRTVLERVRDQYAEEPELHALMSQSASQSYMSQPYRGFVMLNHRDQTEVDIQKCETNKRELWYVFTGMGCQWSGMAKDMMQLETFSQSIMRTNGYLEEFDIDLYELIMSDDSSAFTNTVNTFVAIAAIQVVLVDVLSELGLSPDGIIGHSVGELGCGYADGSLTARETVLAAYWRGRCIVEAELEDGAMAAVGLTWQEAKERCPEGVVPACHNAEDTVTVSGPAQAVHDFVVQLKEEGYFAREVSSNGVAFHSYYMSSIAPKLKQCLEKVITPKPRGKRWISTSISQESWGCQLHSMSSADYHVNNLVSPVLFQEALAYIPENAVTIEIAPHALLQSILKRSVSQSVTNIGLQKRGKDSDNLLIFYQGIGKIYQSGFNPDVSALYTGVSFPVSRGTPSLSSLVQWDHSTSYDVPTEADFDLHSGSGGKVSYEFSLADNSENDNKYLEGHKIDGRIIFPATGYLVLAWRTLASYVGVEYQKLPVTIEDVRIFEATLLQAEGVTTIDVSLLQSTGTFEITEGGKVKCSGKISASSPEEAVIQPISIDQGTQSEEGPTVELTSEDIYKELRLRGYEYGGLFRGITRASMKGEHGTLKWNENWISFLDTMLQISILSSDERSLALPTAIRKIAIDPQLQYEAIMSVDEETFAEVHQDTDLKLTQTSGVQIFDITVTAAPRRKSARDPIIESYEFVPNQRVVAASPDFQEYLDCCAFAAYSSLKCAGDNVRALRVDGSLLKQMAKLCKPGCDVEALLDKFPKNERFALLEYLRCLQTDPSADVSRLGEDRLLSSIMSMEYLKPALDIVLENSGTNKLKITEISDLNSYQSWFEPTLGVYRSQPLVQTDYTLWCGSERELNDERITLITADYSEKNIPTYEQHLVFVSNWVLEVESVSSFSKKMLKSGGFVLTCVFNVEMEEMTRVMSDTFNLVYQVQDPLQTLCLWKIKTEPVAEDFVEIPGFGTEWVVSLKEKLASLGTMPDSHLWIVSNVPPNGTIGLVNCLKLEENGKQIRCLFNAGGTKLPEIDDEEIQAVKSKDLVMNVYCNGVWGSYRHLPVKDQGFTATQHAYVNVHPAGSGLANLRWIESPMRHCNPSSPGICQVAYAALNFRDIMLATGKLAPEAIPGHEKMQGCLLGMEFSGYLPGADSGAPDRRVMGLSAAKALATCVETDDRFVWDVPEEWSMGDAATVPVVYSTAYYALIVRGRLRRGEAVLIHSGSGGVGQAAISIALSMGCNVFTTVGTQEKREFLLSRYPQLKPSHILNSRSSSFEQEVMKLTAGRGVNMVLNSLAGDKLQASVRVLAKHGRFMEIGKFDLSNNSTLGMSIFLKNVSFHGILLDSLFEGDNDEWSEVRDLVSRGIGTGVVRPLSHTNFTKYKIEEAFRFMASGKHIGKVIIEVNNETTSGVMKPTQAVSRYTCSPDKSYLIIGGLGGFGLELSQWLASRGARKLVLTSRSGVTNGYQAKVIGRLISSGVEVVVSKKNAANYSEAEELIHQCVALGPLGGLFNLAMVLRDAMMENQTEAMFKAVFEPKVASTQNLDSLTRELCCGSLDNFTVFSSISGGRGNAGQANYGFANTAMERICERRKMDGLPGKTSVIISLRYKKNPILIYLFDKLNK